MKKKIETEEIRGRKVNVGHRLGSHDANETWSIISHELVLVRGI